MVALVHVSNMLGAVLPVHDVAEAAHKVWPLCHTLIKSALKGHELSAGCMHSFVPTWHIATGV